MSRATLVLLQQAKEIRATPFQINAAAILLATNGLDSAQRYLNGCRTHFESAAQVRAFLRGKRWDTEARTATIERTDRGWLVRLRVAEKSESLRQLLAGTNAAVGEASGGRDV